MAQDKMLRPTGTAAVRDGCCEKCGLLKKSPLRPPWEPRPPVCGCAPEGQETETKTLRPPWMRRSGLL